MQVACLILAGTETREGLGRLVNVLEVAKAFKEGGDEVMLVFDGAGTQGLAELVNPQHTSHCLYHGLWKQIACTCSFCAGAFGERSNLEAAEIAFLSEYKDHPNVHRLF